MSSADLEFFYDYVDPASYLLDHLVRSLAAEQGLHISHRPFEIRRPPATLVDARDPDWFRYHKRMEEEARSIGVALERPPLVPWSRKAHELALLARDADRFPRVHAALYRAYFVEGRDLGRVDVLVRIGAGAGFEPTAVKAALDVDHHLSELEAERDRAERLGVRGVPTLLARHAQDEKLEGFHRRGEIHTFLKRTSSRT